MLLRALAALTPIPLWWLWLGHFFTFWVNNACGDCSPPQPLIPDNVLVGAALLGLILFLVFFALAIFTFVRTRRRPADLAPR